MQRHAQRSYNKSKLTDLRQTETALHGRLQRLPRQQHPQRPEEGLPEDVCKDAETVIQKETDTFNKKVDEIIAAKEKEIMTV